MTPEEFAVTPPELGIQAEELGVAAVSFERDRRTSERDRCTLQRHRRNSECPIPPLGRTNTLPSLALTHCILAYCSLPPPPRAPLARPLLPEEIGVNLSLTCTGAAGFLWQLPALNQSC